VEIHSSSGPGLRTTDQNERAGGDFVQISCGQPALRSAEVGWAIRGRARAAPATDARDEIYSTVLPLNVESAADRLLVRQLGEVVDAPEDVVDRHAVIAAVPRHVEAG